MAATPIDELLLAEGLVDERSISNARTEAIARQRKLAELASDLGSADHRALALIQSSLDTIGAGMTKLASQRRFSR